MRDNNGGVNLNKGPREHIFFKVTLKLKHDG